MTWLNLTPIEFGALFSMAAAIAVWMYLMHQRPRRTVVSTLRFWESVEQAPVAKRRRRVQEPWALLAQLMFLFLVLLALANPRRNGLFPNDHSVLLMVDGSVWTQVQPDGQQPWIDQVRARAIRYLNSLPADEQVALMRTDGEGIPVVPFTRDHQAVREAIVAMRASDMTADLPRSLELADSALAGRADATLVYIGPGMADDAQLARLASFQRALRQRDAKSRPRLVVHLVGSPDSIEDRGITRLALRRDAEHPERWRLLAQLRNYGSHPTLVHLRVVLDGKAVEMKPVYLDAHATGSAEATFDDEHGGVLAAHIDEGDALSADNDAVAYLPAFRPARVAVYTADSSMLQRVLAADPFVQVEFVRPGASPATTPDVSVYDGVAPPANARNAVIFVPGRDARELRLTAWNPQHPVTRWIRTRDVSVHTPVHLQTVPGDIVLAQAGSEALAVARERDGHKQVVIAFDPRQSNFPLQPAFPLLMAASIEWMTGTVMESSDPSTAGEVEVPGEASGVSSGDGRQAPFAVAGGNVHLIAARAGVYRVDSRDGTRAVAVNVPPLPGQRWKVDDNDDNGEAAPRPTPPRYFWTVFVLLAMVPLWAEWMFYYTKERRLAKSVSVRHDVDQRRVA